jgi:hypothetical protein
VCVMAVGVAGRLGKRMRTRRFIYITEMLYGYYSIWTAGAIENTHADSRGINFGSKCRMCHIVIYILEWINLRVCMRFPSLTGAPNVFTHIQHLYETYANSRGMRGNTN